MTHNIMMMLGMTLLAALLSVYALWRLDGRLLPLAVRSLGKYAFALALLVLVVWGLVAVDSWWLNACWLLVVVPVVALMAVQRGRVELHRWWMSLSAVWLLVVCLLTGGVLVCMNGFSTPSFVGVVGVLLAQSMPAVAAGLHRYQGSKLATQAHQEYLLGNGATLLESLQPSVRRGVRALLMVSLRSVSVVSVLTLPLLLSGLLMGSVPPVAAVVVTLLLAVSGLLVSMAVFLATVFVAERKIRNV